MRPPALLQLLPVFAAAFVLIASVVAAGLALLEKLVPARPRPSSRATWIHAALLLAPMVVALLGCVALAAQNPFSSCHRATHGLRHPHLCLQAPMSAVILGGLTSSTLLNRLVLPPLFARFARPSAALPAATEGALGVP